LLPGILNQYFSNFDKQYYHDWKQTFCPKEKGLFDVELTLTLVFIPPDINQET